MHECRICDFSVQGLEAARRHESRLHREAYFANLDPETRYYVAPPRNFPFCDVCNLYIGPGAVVSHKLNSSHKALVAALTAKAAGESSPGEPGILPAAPSLDNWMDIPVRASRRARVEVAEVTPLLEVEEFVDREDLAPDRKDDAPSQVP